VATVFNALLAILIEETDQLRLHRLGDQFPRTRAQQRVQRIRFPDLWV